MLLVNAEFKQFKISTSLHEHSNTYHENATAVSNKNDKKTEYSNNLPTSVKSMFDDLDSLKLWLNIRKTISVRCKNIDLLFIASFKKYIQFFLSQ